MGGQIEYTSGGAVLFESNNTSVRIAYTSVRIEYTSGGAGARLWGCRSWLQQCQI